MAAMDPQTEINFLPLTKRSSRSCCRTKNQQNGEADMGTLRYDGLSPAVLRALADDRIRNDLLSFIIKVFETLLPGEHLYLNWHIPAMAHQPEQIRLGKSRRLVITLPPRHL